MDDLARTVDDQAVERACEQVTTVLSDLMEIGERVWLGGHGELTDMREIIAVHHKRLADGLQALSATEACSAILHRRKLACLDVLEKWCGPDDSRVTTLALQLAREGGDLLGRTTPTQGAPTGHSLLANFWSSLPWFFGPQRSS